MPFLLLFLLGLLGWALWAGKIRMQQLPPIVLGIAGLFALSKGAWIAGGALTVIALAWYRGMTWRLAKLKPRPFVDRKIENARALLGATQYDDADTIRLLHRKLISENHPDKGGSGARASALNEARDLLLSDIANRDL